MPAQYELDLRNIARVIGAFAPENLHNDEHVRAFILSINQLMNFTIRYTGADQEATETTNQVLTCFNQIYPRVLHLLEPRELGLEPYERLADDRFNIVAPHLFGLLSFIVRHYKFFRELCKSEQLLGQAETERFNEAMKQFFGQFSQHDAATGRYSTFVQQNSVRVFGAARFAFRPNASYFHGLVQFVQSLAQFRRGLHERLLKVANQLFKISDGLEQNRPEIRHRALVARFPYLPTLVIFQLRDVVDLLLHQFPNKALPDYRVLERAQDEIGRYVGDSQVELIKREELAHLAAAAVADRLYETAADVARFKCQIDACPPADAFDRVYRRYDELAGEVSAGHPNLQASALVYHVLHSRFPLHELQYLILSQVRHNEDLELPANQLHQLLYAAALSVLPVRFGEALISQRPGIGIRLCFYRNDAARLEQSLQQYLGDRELFQIGHNDLELLFDPRMREDLAVLDRMQLQNNELEVIRALANLGDEKSRFAPNIFFNLSQQEFRLIISRVARQSQKLQRAFYKKLYQSVSVKTDVNEGLLDKLVGAIQSTSIFEINNDMSLMFILAFLNNKELREESVYAVIDKLSGVTNAYINATIIRVLLQQNPPVLLNKCLNSSIAI